MWIANFFTLFLIFLPAFLANASPVVAKNIPIIRELSWPIHERFFGKNKTVRGLITGILVGMITGLLLYFCRHIFVRFLTNYTTIYNLYHDWKQAMLVGGTIAAGALVGDMGKSFVKRRLGKKPGSMFQPWDGIDYMIGAIIFMLPWYTVSIWGAIFLLIIGPLLSLMMNTIAYSIG